MIFVRTRVNQRLDIFARDNEGFCSELLGQRIKYIFEPSLCGPREWSG